MASQIFLNSCAYYYSNPTIQIISLYPNSLQFRIFRRKNSPQFQIFEHTCMRARVYNRTQHLQIFIHRYIYYTSGYYTSRMDT